MTSLILVSSSTSIKGKKENTGMERIKKLKVKTGVLVSEIDQNE